MTIPIIGVTTYHGNSERGLPAVLLLRAYIDALILAGGAPALIPCVAPNRSDLTEDGRQSLYARLDGILLTGGGDIGIEHFNGALHPRVGEVDAARDTLEFWLLRAATRDGLPFLGICRGFQVLNVVLGGSLYTHIEDQKPGAIKHDYYPDHPRNLIAHQVKVNEDSRLAAILGTVVLDVNSLHHQGAKDIPPALKPVAYAPDGLVEALELPGHTFGLAVQWHPEWLMDQPSARRLFEAFVEAASKT